MILMISYDLYGRERPDAYKAVRDMIEEKSRDSKRALYSQWFVETNSTVQTWHERMQAVTDDDDNWFINEVTSPRQGWLNKDVWEWLKERE